MLKNLKNKKKKGFTLVELVVVIAIIAILAAVLIPQITGYIENSRKTEVIQEAREIMTAVESVQATTGRDLSGSNWTTLQGNSAIATLVTPASVRTIPGGTTVTQLKQILDSERYTFTVVKDANNVYQFGTAAPISQ